MIYQLKPNANSFGTSGKRGKPDMIDLCSEDGQVWACVHIDTFWEAKRLRDMPASIYMRLQRGETVVVELVPIAAENDETLRAMPQ